MYADVPLLKDVLEATLQLERIWTRPRIGLCLTIATLEGRQLRAEEVARECNISDDTVRRVVRELLNIGRVECDGSGRGAKYRAAPEWARRTVDIVRLGDNRNGARPI